MTQDAQALSNPNLNAVSLFAESDDDYVNMRARDLILPRATILQALSPDVVDGRFPSGTVIDSATKATIIKPKEEGKYIIPLMQWYEWIEWNRVRNVSKEERIVARSVDPQGSLSKRAEAWETYINNEGKEVCVVTEYFNYIVAIVDDETNDYDNIYITGFAKSSHRVGKMWMNRMYKTKINIDGTYGRPPMWAMRWAYKTELVRKDGNSFYVPVVGDGKENPRGDWERLRALSASFKERRAEIMDRNATRDHEDAPAQAEVVPNTEM